MSEVGHHHHLYHLRLRLTPPPTHTVTTTKLGTPLPPPCMISAPPLPPPCMARLPPTFCSLSTQPHQPAKPSKPVLDHLHAPSSSSSILPLLAHGPDLEISTATSSPQLPLLHQIPPAAAKLRPSSFAGLYHGIRSPPPPPPPGPLCWPWPRHLHSHLLPPAPSICWPWPRHLHTHLLRPSPLC